MMKNFRVCLVVLLLVWTAPIVKASRNTSLISIITQNALNIPIDNQPSVQQNSTRCFLEPGLSVDKKADGLRRIQSEENCCQLCDQEKDCIFSMTSGSECYLVTDLAPDAIVLQNAEKSQTNELYYSKKEGTLDNDFCTLCECRMDDQYIDCRGQNLTLMPATFTPDTAQLPWTPRLLDLRENDHLHLIAFDDLASVSEFLEEIFLPRELQYLSPQIAKSMSKLSIVKVEESSDASSTVRTANDDDEQELNNAIAIQNVIVGKDDFFDNICCSLGESIELEFPSDGLTFCDMHEDDIGVDVVYEPFTQYFKAHKVTSRDPSSAFMAEASESPEKCAEFCKISTECIFFEFNQPLEEKEKNTCWILEDTGSPREACCDDEDYSDNEKSMPAYTGGRPPRTRHILDMARVLVSSSSLSIGEGSQYSATYDIRLGSSPLRGAVWIEPKFASTTETSLEVQIKPSRIVLYDNETVATVLVEALNIHEMIGATEALVLQNSVSACDKAFTAYDNDDSSQTDVLVTIVGPPSVTDESISIISYTVPSLIVLLVAVASFFIVNEKRKRKSNAVWSVKVSELRFDSPPEILGQGTFGLVLLAEYRGTQVAVKRVLPRSAISETFIQQDDSVSESISGEEQKVQTEDDETSKNVDIESGRDSSDNNSKICGLSTVSPISSFGSGGTKIVSPILSLTKYSRKRDELRLKADFIKEMGMISKLRHPCVTTVMGAIVDRNEEPMLIMEHMERGSLYDVLHNDTVVIGGELLLPILRDIAQGMRFLHASTPQVLHGDIKSANILVDSKFRAKVADFGLTQKRQLGATGTPFWMAPELLRPESQNTAESDAYSFGIVLYEVYSRKDPYNEDSHMEAEEILLQVADPKICKRPPTPKSCPPKVQSLMAECLTHDPKERPTYEELDLQLKRMNVDTMQPAVTNDPKPDELLDTIFPKHVADALRNGNKVEPETRDMVTILHAEVVNFTSLSKKLGPVKMSDMLGRLYSAFDDLTKTHKVYKVQTIGNAYMAVTNLIEDQDDHTKRIAEFAVAAVKISNEIRVDVNDVSRGFAKVRIGIHSGKVVATVVGSVCPRYCLFGSIINIVARMQLSSEENRIHCSASAAGLLRTQNSGFPLYERGLVNVGGKGNMLTYWVNETKLNSLVKGMGSLHSTTTSRVGKSRHYRSNNSRLPVIQDVEQPNHKNHKKKQSAKIRTNPTFLQAETYAGIVPSGSSPVQGSGAESSSKSNDKTPNRPVRRSNSETSDDSTEQSKTPSARNSNLVRKESMDTHFAIGAPAGSAQTNFTPRKPVRVVSSDLKEITTAKPVSP